MSTPGQESGHAVTSAGFDWGSYVSALVSEHGSLAALAERVAAQRGYRDDLGSVERGLRRLRGRGQKNGGVWGRRVIAACGLPDAVERRVRWMGSYHSRFTDLPTSVCRELLVPWDLPPARETGARVWVQLGFASVALRRRDHEQAALHLDQAEMVARPPDADVELALTRAYLVAKDDDAACQRWLDHAQAVLERDGGTMRREDRACLFARWIDQCAYRLNRPHVGAPGAAARDHAAPDHAAAAALYARIDDAGPPFARCRYHNGMGWSLLRQGDVRSATQHAKASVRQAGDSGSLRLRAMALNLLAACQRDTPNLAPSVAESTRARAAAIGRRLEDAELIGRYDMPSDDGATSGDHRRRRRR